MHKVRMWTVVKRGEELKAAAPKEARTWPTPSAGPQPTRNMMRRSRASHNSPMAIGRRKWRMALRKRIRSKYTRTVKEHAHALGRSDEQQET